MSLDPNQICVALANAYLDALSQRNYMRIETARVEQQLADAAARLRAALADSKITLTSIVLPARDAVVTVDDSHPDGVFMAPIFPADPAPTEKPKS